MLTRLEAQLPELNASERKAAQWILRHLQDALELDTRSLAAQAGVSQPTLVRLAHSLGCSGYQEFRMRLARELGAAREAEPSTLASIASNADPAGLSMRLFDVTLRSLAHVRDTLDRHALARAMELLDRAPRVRVFGSGPAATLAAEAVRRLLRLETDVAAHTEPELQLLAAQRLRAGDAVLLLWLGGADPVVPCRAAQEARASVVALTASPCPELKAESHLALDLANAGDALAPNLAQLAMLMLIDLLAIGVAARRGERLARTRREA